MVDSDHTCSLPMYSFSEIIGLEASFAMSLVWRRCDNRRRTFGAQGETSKAPWGS